MKIMLISIMLFTIVSCTGAEIASGSTNSGNIGGGNIIEKDGVTVAPMAIEKVTIVENVPWWVWAVLCAVIVVLLIKIGWEVADGINRNEHEANKKDVHAKSS